MDWIKSKSVGVFLPGFADEFIRGKASKRFESSGEVVSCHEISQVLAKLSVAVIVEAVNGGLFDGAIHAFDLSVGPRVIGFGQAMIDSMPKANPVKRVPTETSGWSRAILGQISKLDSVVGQHGMDPIGNGCYQCQGERLRPPSYRHVPPVPRRQTWKCGRWPQTNRACLQPCAPQPDRCENSQSDSTGISSWAFCCPPLPAV